VHVCVLFPRAKTIEGKRAMFWTQGDFGYMKQEMDSMMALCRPKQKVRCTAASAELPCVSVLVTWA